MSFTVLIFKTNVILKRALIIYRTRLRFCAEQPVCKTLYKYILEFGRYRGHTLINEIVFLYSYGLLRLLIQLIKFEPMTYVLYCVSHHCGDCHVNLLQTPKRVLFFVWIWISNHFIMISNTIMSTITLTVILFRGLRIDCIWINWV